MFLRKFPPLCRIIDKEVKGQAFLSACEEIKDILTETDEWQALPDYEYYYD